MLEPDAYVGSYRVQVRLVVFTARADLTETAFWTVLTRTPGVSAILLCKQEGPRDPRTLVRRFWSNLKKHGPVYIPYRLWSAIVGKLGGGPHPLRLSGGSADLDRPPVSELATVDLHSEEAKAHIREWGPDLGVSVGAPILQRELFSIPARGTVNIHGGKVPDFRGAPPGFWELWAGADEIGSTLHEMTERLDAGDVIHSAVAPIYPNDSLDSVSKRAEELSVRVLERGLRDLIAGDAHPEPQPEGGKPFRSPSVWTRIRLATRLRMRSLWSTLRSPFSMAKSVIYWALVYLFRPVRDAVRTVTGSHPVRVFTFHRVTRLCRDGMTVSPDLFRDQVEFLTRTHRIVPLKEAVDLLRSGARLRRPVAVITFDDGYESVFELAYPILASRGLTATCFLSTGLVGTSRRFQHDVGSPVEELMEVMDWDQVRTLFESGWTMGAHTVNHVRLSEVGVETLRDELSAPIEELKGRLGIDWIALAYPFGTRSDISEEAVRTAERVGYDAAFQDYGGEARSPVDRFQLPRIELGGDYPRLYWKARGLGIRLRRDS